MKNTIIELIKKKIKIHHIHIEDLTKNHIKHQDFDGGGHYKIIIVSDEFNSFSLLKRHKMIYDILGKMIKKEIHAISLKTLTIDEYNKKKEAR